MLANIIVKLIGSAFPNTLTFNHDIINYDRFGFLKLDIAVSLLPKKIFSPFLDTKPFFAMQIAKHYDKHLIPSKSWDQDVFF